MCRGSCHTACDFFLLYSVSFILLGGRKPAARARFAGMMGRYSGFRSLAEPNGFLYNEDAQKLPGERACPY